MIYGYKFIYVFEVSIKNTDLMSVSRKVDSRDKNGE